MKLFFRFLKDKRIAIFTEIGTVLIFFITFYLYEIPVKVVMYPAFLVLLISVVVLLASFVKVKKKHEQIEILCKSFNEIEKYLANPGDIIEEDYNNLVNTVMGELRKSIDESSLKYNDLIDYYSIWVHQIKTPIASMRLLVQGEDSDFSRRIYSDLLRIEQYVEMVLTFLRLDSKESDYLIKEYDIDPIIKASVKRFMSDFISRKIKLEYEPVNLKVITDEKWLSFVIEQIISNSLKYTKEGSIKIYVSDESKLCIKDTGIGILPEDLARIFDKGYTGFNGRMDKKASGIGLYLCKRICTNLGHSIKAESEAGVGTTIIIDLSRDNIGIE